MNEAALVGRGDEQRVLRDYLERRASVVLAGASGVGKTRLARQVVAMLANAGRSTNWLSATGSSRRIPLGVLGPLLATARADSPSPANPFEIVGILRSFLAPDADSGAPIVAVDDAHLVDEVSAMVLHQLAVSGGVTVLATVRAGEPAPDAIVSLWKDGWAERVELQPLSREETDELVAQLVGGPCGPLELQELWRVSQGSPLYVRELVRGALASGALACVGTTWRLRGGLPVGGRLAELIRLRVDQLTAAARESLDFVALGEPLPIEVLETWADPASTTEAEQSGLVEIGLEGGRVLARLGHPIIGEVVRSLMPATRRRQLASRLADAYSRLALVHREDLLRCVTWRLEAGERGPVEMLVSGAREATASLDYALGERLARAALSAAPTELEAALVLAECLYRQRRFAEVVSELGALAPSDEQGRVEVAIAQAKSLWFGLGDTVGAESVLDRAAAALTEESAQQGLAAYRAKLRAAGGFPAEALALATAAAGNLQQDAAVILTALGAVTASHAFSGRVTDALAASARCREPRLAAAARSHELSDWGRTCAWVSVFLTGDVARAGPMGQPFLDLGLERCNPQFVAAGSVALGSVAAIEGNFESAARQLRNGWEVLRRERWAGVEILAGANLAQALCFSGDLTEARKVLDETKALQRDGLNWFDPLLDIAAAWLDAAEGHWSKALARLHDVATTARSRGQFPYEAHALHAMARLGSAREAAGRLSALADLVEGPFVVSAAAHAAALAAADAAGLERAADAFEDGELRLLAAEAAASAARRYDETGQRAPATALALRSERLLARCPGAVSPIIASLQTPQVLSIRELEVARLAVAGSSSRDIARELFLSVRTVEAHLAHVYVKLGICGRTELSRALSSSTTGRQ